MKDWIPITQERPPLDKLLDTKIDDEDGCRNEQQLFYTSNLWFLPDGDMYVYYEPTHWRLPEPLKPTP